MTTMPIAPQEPSLRDQLSVVAHFLRRSLRFWRELLGVLALGVLAFGLFLHFHEPRFRSDTVILYVETGDTTQEVESTDVQRSVTVRLKELLYARPNLERVVRKFDLYPELRRSYGMVDALEELKKHVEFRAPGGDTFSIGFEGRSAREAQAVTSELARLVIDGDAELRKKQATVALDFLVGERATRDAELKQAEEKLAGFMAQHPRFALDATPLANGAAIRATMGAPATGAGAARNFAPRPTSAVDASLSAGRLAPPAALPTAGAAKPSDGEEARARAALAAARESLTEKLAHYTPAHPDVRAAEAAVQRATERLAVVASNGSAAPTAAPAATAPPGDSPAPAGSATTAPHLARAASSPRAAAAQGATPSPAARADTLVELETQWLRLTRAVTEARQRLDQIESQLFRADVEANSESGGHGVQVSVIDPAFLPQRPVPPGNVTLGLIFLAVAGVLGGLVMLVRATLDDRVFDARDLGASLLVLVQVPRHRERKRYVAS